MKAELKVAVVGCGALGSYYGARLVQLGLPTWFLLRSDYETVRNRGVQILSDSGNLHVRPQCARRPEEIGPCDLVLIGLKTTANGALPALVAPLVHKGTAVLTLQNGLGNEEDLAVFVPKEQILGGLCFVCLNRIEPGVVHHLAHGNIVLGEFARGPEPRTHELGEVFRRSGVPCKVTDNLAQAHWEKLVWNIPFNGLGVAGTVGWAAMMNGDATAVRPAGPVLTTQDLLRDTHWLGLVQALMREVILAAQALGFPVSLDLADRMIDKTRGMGAYKASTLVDYERGRPLELKSLFLEPLRRAMEARVETPCLIQLCRVLQAIDPGRGVA